jgi:PTS hybrid protein
MVGIVVVSHSAPLADAAVNLALQMIHGAPPAMAIAAGTSDGRIGTDAVRVAAAIDSLPAGEPALVIMDLGSAVLSAEMSLDFLSDPSRDVRLSSAPFVEGLLAAVVRSAGGASLDEVAREAELALTAKSSQLAPASAQSVAPEIAPPPASSRAGEVRGEALILNEIGLHARPAAVVAGALAEFDADVWVWVDGKEEVMGQSPISLMALGARKGDMLHVRATGPDAQFAVDSLVSLTRDGFGELDLTPRAT